MSLDVTLLGEEKTIKCQCDCGHKHSRRVQESVFEFNVTHNLEHMASEAGLYEAMWRPEEIGATKAKDIIGKLYIGLDALKKEPENFKKFNPENGWGKYENLLEFAEKYLKACETYPDATIQVSR